MQTEKHGLGRFPAKEKHAKLAKSRPYTTQTNAYLKEGTKRNYA